MIPVDPVVASDWNEVYNPLIRRQMRGFYDSG